MDFVLPAIDDGNVPKKIKNNESKVSFVCDFIVA